MEPMFKTCKRQSTVDIVINNIKQLIMEKKLVPGQRMPSEMEISGGLGVSRGSVREAMKILSAFGVVDIKPGDGTYLSHSPQGSIVNPLMFDFLLYGPDTQELSEFRKVIEMAIVELIILNKEKNQQQRQNIYGNVEDLHRLCEEDAEMEKFVKNDLEFHNLLGDACCNHLAKKVYGFVLEFLEPTIKDTHRDQYKGEMSYPVHNQIAEAIRTNNLQVAKDAIYHSVDVWKALQNQ